MIIASTGVGVTAIGSTLVTLIMAGASLEAISAALGAHLTVVANSLGILGGLVTAIRGILGC